MLSRFENARQDLFRQYQAGAYDASGLCSALSHLTDTTLIELTHDHPLPPNATLLAVGGYGREQLFPYSDVDIMVLLDHETSNTSAIEQFINACWNNNIKISHHVRTIDSCLEEEDITFQTTLLDMRFLAGNEALYQHFSQRFKKQFDAAQFFLDKRLELEQRHQKYNNTPFTIETNCKESVGGLRDIHFLHWIARAAGFGADWDSLVTQGLMSTRECRQLKRAEQGLIRLRVELHLLAKRDENRLIYDLQPQLAEIFNIGPAQEKRSSEILMRNYYWGARLIHQISQFMIQNLQDYFFPVAQQYQVPIDEHFCNTGGRLDITDNQLFERDPSRIFATFIVMAQHPELSELHVRTQRALWKAGRLINQHFRQQDINKHLFIQIFKQERAVIDNLKRLNMLDLLPRYLPVFKKIVGQLQHDHYHVYTVDQHILTVIRNLYHLGLIDQAQEDEFASQVMCNIDYQWVLYLAALFHDIAKGRGGDHSELGAIDAQTFVDQHPIDPIDGELIVFLVRYHLILSQTAQKQDLTDPEIIHSFAQKMGDQRHLTGLYLLTIADIRGTGPTVMTAWKSLQINQLYRSTLHLLGNQTDLLGQRQQEVNSRMLLEGISPQEQEDFLRCTGVRYVLRHSADEIIWHIRTLKEHLEQTIIRARPAVDAMQVVVYTPDQAALFKNICAYFYKHGIGVLDAKIHTCTNHFALNTFTITSPHIQTDPRSFANLVEVGLQQQLAHPQMVPLKTYRTFGQKMRRLRTFPIVPHVQLCSTYANHWRLDIHCTNMPGILYSLATLFCQYKVDVLSAKVMTLGDRVEDIFMLQCEHFTHATVQLEFKRDVLTYLEKITP